MIGEFHPHRWGRHGAVVAAGPPASVTPDGSIAAASRWLPRDGDQEGFDRAMGGVIIWKCELARYPPDR